MKKLLFFLLFLTPFLTVGQSRDCAENRGAFLKENAGRTGKSFASTFALLINTDDERERKLAYEADFLEFFISDSILIYNDLRLYGASDTTAEKLPLRDYLRLLTLNFHQDKRFVFSDLQSDSLLHIDTETGHVFSSVRLKKSVLKTNKTEPAKMDTLLSLYLELRLKITCRQNVPAGFYIYQVNLYDKENTINEEVKVQISEEEKNARNLEIVEKQMQTGQARQLDIRNKKRLQGKLLDYQESLQKYALFPLRPKRKSRRYNRQLESENAELLSYFDNDSVPIFNDLDPVTGADSIVPAGRYLKNMIEDFPIGGLRINYLNNFILSRLTDEGLIKVRTVRRLAGKHTSGANIERTDSLEILLRPVFSSNGKLTDVKIAAVLKSRPKRITEENPEPESPAVEAVSDTVNFAFHEETLLRRLAWYGRGYGIILDNDFPDKMAESWKESLLKSIVTDADSASMETAVIGKKGAISYKKNSLRDYIEGLRPVGYSRVDSDLQPINKPSGIYLEILREGGRYTDEMLEENFLEALSTFSLRESGVYRRKMWYAQIFSGDHKRGKFARQSAWVLKEVEIILKKTEAGAGRPGFKPKPIWKAFIGDSRVIAAMPLDDFRQRTTYGETAGR